MCFSREANELNTNRILESEVFILFAKSFEYVTIFGMRLIKNIQ